MSIPEVFFRETIDVNRFSNAVANKLVANYIQVITNATEELKKIDIRQQRAAAGVVISPQTRKRLRAIIAQSKAGMDKWHKGATRQMIKEIEGLVDVQVGFIENELKKVVKSGKVPINSVAVSQRYATSFVKTDPTQINIFTSKEFTEDDFIKFGAGKFQLTARQGAMITLPNGQTVQKAFRGIATRNQDLLARNIRAGVFSGETTQQIARRLAGKLDFDFEGTAKQAAAAGGDAIKVASHQIQTIVRTSVNQVTNQASQSVYAANKKVTPKYQYVATLDSKTSAICQRLDGQKFEYNKGALPPQHFNCRSTTVPVVDFDGLQKKYPDLEKPPITKLDTRPSQTGRVPQGTQYGDWLLDADRELQVKTLGSEGKVRIFKKLAKKEGSGHAALRKMIRNDGTEVSLERLQELYGTARVAAQAVETIPAVVAAKTPTSITSPTMTTEGVDDWLANNKLGDIQTFLEDSLDSVEKLGGLTAINVKKMRQFMKKGKIVSQFNMQNEKTFEIASLGDRFLKGKNLKAFAASNETVVKRFDFINNKLPAKSISANTRDWQELWNGRGATRRGSHKDLFENSIKSLEAGGSIMSQPIEFTRKVQNYLFGNATGGTHGYTIFNSAMVHTRLKNTARKISNISARNIRASLKRTLETNFKFSKFKGTRYERYRQGVEQGIREVWSNSAPLDGDADWFVTFVHEMGHQIHYQSGAASLGQQFRKLGGMTYPTEYSRKNALEQFTESFVQYVFNPEGLQERAPRLYKWVDETIEQSLKNL